MGRKVEAAYRFATTPGRRAAIGVLDDAIAMLRGASGTSIERGVSDPVIMDSRIRERRDRQALARSIEQAWLVSLARRSVALDLNQGVRRAVR